MTAVSVGQLANRSTRFVYKNLFIILKTMKNQELVDFLRSYGVCEVCQLRYLKARGSEYKDINETLRNVSSYLK